MQLHGRNQTANAPSTTGTPSSRCCLTTVFRPFGLAFLMMSTFATCSGTQDNVGHPLASDVASPTAASDRTLSSSPPPPQKIGSPVLSAFDEIIDQPQAIKEWNASQRHRRYAALFSKVLELASRDPDRVILALIAGLNAPEPAVYQPAAYLLRHISGTNLGHPTHGSLAQRRQAQIDWSNWWSRTRENKAFLPITTARNNSTLIVDEIPGRLVGNDDDPPGRLLHFQHDGTTIFETYTLKMPYDAAITPDGQYWVNIIRARSVYKVTNEGNVISKINVGGYPCSVQQLATGNLVVAGWDDDVPGFVREFDQNGKIVWRVENLRWPWHASRLSNGNTLIADAGRNRVFEVNKDKSEVWAVENLGPPRPELFDALGPVYAQRLADGNTLVSIRGLSKVVEIDRQGTIVWDLGSKLIRNQYSAVRLWNGNTLIADGGNFRVIEVNVDRQIVWEKGGFGYPAKAYRY